MCVSYVVVVVSAEAMQSLVYRAYEFSRYNQLVVCPEPPGMTQDMYFLPNLANLSNALVGYGESPGPVTMEKFYENAEQALDYAIVLSTKTGPHSLFLFVPGSFESFAISSPRK